MAHRVDRRAHRRGPLRAPAMLEARDGCRTVRCRNVSAGGLAVESSHPVRVGDDVDVYFELPSGIAVQTRAQIVRRDETVVALRFSELSREQRVALRAHSRISGLHRIPQSGFMRAVDRAASESAR